MSTANIIFVLLGMSGAFLIALQLLPSLLPAARRLLFNRKLSRIYALLAQRFGFERTKEARRTDASAWGKIDGHDVTVQSLLIGGVLFLHLTVKSRRFLPLPLAIAKRGASSPAAHTGIPALLLDTADFAPLNCALGRPILDADLARDLERLKTRSDSLIAGDDTLQAFFRCRTTDAGLFLDTVRGAARIVSRLFAVKREADLAPHLLIHRLHQVSKPEERRAWLRQLIGRYAGDPAVRRAIEEISYDNDREIAFTAAEALGRDRLEWLKAALSTRSRSDKLQVIRKMCDPRVAGGMEFLLDLYHQTADPFLRDENIKVLREADDPRIIPLFIEALRDEAAVVRTSAVAALAERGGRESLAGLQALAADADQPPTLRSSARQAAEKIAAGLNLKPGGRLSLADGAPGEGGLSLADADEGGELSLADTKEKGAAPDGGLSAAENREPTSED